MFSLCEPYESADSLASWEECSVHFSIWWLGECIGFQFRFILWLRATRCYCNLFCVLGNVCGEVSRELRWVCTRMRQYSEQGEAFVIMWIHFDGLMHTVYK